MSYFQLFFIFYPSFFKITLQKQMKIITYTLEKYFVFYFSYHQTCNKNTCKPLHFCFFPSFFHGIQIRKGKRKNTIIFLTIIFFFNIFINQTGGKIFSIYFLPISTIEVMILRKFFNT